MEDLSTGLEAWDSQRALLTSAYNDNIEILRMSNFVSCNIIY